MSTSQGSFINPASTTDISAQAPLDRLDALELQVGSRQTLKSRWDDFVTNFLALVDKNTGLLLVAASQLFFSSMNVAVKKVNSVEPPVPTLELIVIRMGITWICSISYMLITNIPDPILGPKGVRLLLLIRGLVGFFGLFGLYYSLQYLSLSDATVLTFLAPLATAMAGALLLNETFALKEAFAGIFSLIGVVLIARPTFIFGDVALLLGVSGVEKGTPQERLGAVGVALLGVLGASGAYTSIRAIGKRAHPLHLLMAFSTLSTLASTIGMVWTRTPVVIPSRWEFVVLLVMIGVFGFVAQTLLTMGLQRETAGRGTLAVYVQIIFAMILERIFFHTTPSGLSLMGSVIILTSAGYVALTKANPSTPPSAPAIVPAVAREGREEDLEEGLSPLAGLDHNSESEPAPHSAGRSDLDDVVGGQQKHADALIRL